MNKPRSLIVLLFLSIFILPFVCQGADKGPAPKERPNVIIISIDTLRADHVGCYGYYRPTTPFIDEFSREAIVFKNAIAQAPFTHSSMASFIMSKYPLHNIVVLLGSFVGCIMNPNYPSLAQLLKNESYASCFISDSPPMFHIKGLKKGFDNFVESEPNNPVLVTNGAVRWIRDHRDSQFFIWVHYLGPHSPYEPNQASSLKTPLKNKDKVLPVASKKSERLGYISIIAKESGHDNLNYYINNYDGKIRLTDEQVGILLDEITKLGLDKNSIIVITADHGEEFGEHNLYCEHGDFLYNTLLRVPLMIKIPDLNSQGRVIDQTVGLVDVIPTIAGILKVAGQKFDGESLLSLLSGDKEDRYIFSDNSLKTSVVFGRWKLIHNLLFDRIPNTMLFSKLIMPKFEKEYELYDFVADPFEEKDLYGADVKIADELRRELSNYEAQSTTVMESELLALFREKAEGSPSKENKGNKENKEEIEALKSLGYLH